MATTISPYATALALNRPKPSHVTDGFYDLDRVTAYGTYEDIWANIAEAFAALLRNGDDPKARRYIPMVRGLIEAVNRYLAKDPEIVWTPQPGATMDQGSMDQFTALINGMMLREEFSVKFLAMKRWWLIKGDALLTLGADPSKPEGSRIRLNEVPPEQYFPIYDNADGERVIGVYLASIVEDDDANEIVQRIEYQKITTQDRAGQFGAPLGSIFYRVSYWKQDGWDDRYGDELKEAEPPSWATGALPGAADPLVGYALPTQITEIPLYHFRNNRRGGLVGRFGTSEIQGLESILAGAIQNTTDEDMAIALLGIGAYWTDSGRPRDAQGKESEWEMAPGTVLELEKDGKFGRVDGVTSVTPIQDHMGWLDKSARGSLSVPDIAAGSLDPANPASGVALQIQFTPILARNMEKEAELDARLTHLLHDLAFMWLPAYEGLTPPLVDPSVTFGNPLPLDRAAALKEIIDMLTARVISIEFAQQAISERLGYQFPTGMLAAIVKEQTELLDATGGRIASDAVGGDPNAADNTPPGL